MLSLPESNHASEVGSASVLGDVYQDLEVRRTQGLREDGSASRAVLGNDRGWWLANFGIFVEANLDPSLGGFGRVETFKVWKRTGNQETFQLVYGDTIGKLWVVLREVVLK